MMIGTQKHQHLLICFMNVESWKEQLNTMVRKSQRRMPILTMVISPIERLY